MNNKMSKMLCIVIALSMICSCNYNDDRQQIFYDEVKEINERHALETIRVPDVNIKDYTPTMNFREVGFTKEELDSLTHFDEFGIITDILTYEQAEKDIDLAFRIFKNCYGAYFYFGGDETFKKAKEQVLSDCELAGESLTVGVLQESLRNHLSFVKDGHLRVDEELVLTKTIYYSNEETTFLKDENGYYLNQRGKKRYVLTVDGNDAVEEYMKCSVNNRGMLVYKLGVLSDEEYDTVEVVFDEGTENFALSLPELKNISGTENYSYDEVNNVPVVAIRSFVDKSVAEQFIESADTIKNSKISVLDLRGNGGGMAHYVARWLDTYDSILSKYIDGNTFAQRYSRANFYIGYSRYRADLPEKNETAALNNLNLYRVGTNRWDREETRKFERSENSNVLFVLVDNYTASAAELFVAALRNKDNVIFVGTNSGGALISGAEVKIVLPNSRTCIQCGEKLRFYYDETVFTEETGFCPDIWVGTDSLVHTLNLISYYKLNK